MEIDPFAKTYQRRRTARQQSTDFFTQVSSSSSGIHGNSRAFAVNVIKRHFEENDGCNIVNHFVPVTMNLQVFRVTKYVLLAEERKPLNTSSLFPCPRGPRSKRKVIFSPMAEGVSAKGISNEGSRPTSSTARPRARRKRKTKSKAECSDAEITIPRRIHFRGQARRAQNNADTITDGRGKLDSATFLHYFMHIWSEFPEEKLKSVTYFDPLWFELYANESNRVMVLNWIKEEDIFSKKYVLVPIVIWSHWSLLIFCHLGENLHSKTNAPCILLLDSLHAIGPRRLEPLIRRLLFDIHESEERPESKEQLKKMPFLIPEVPQQKKGEECGFYVLHYIKLFLDNAPENFNISEGYPYFMKKDWFTIEGAELFCKSLDAYPVVLSDHDDSASVDSSDSVELLRTSVS